MADPTPTANAPATTREWPNLWPDFDVERDPDDGSVSIIWAREGTKMTLVCFATGVLVRVGGGLEGVRTNVEGLAS